MANPAELNSTFGIPGRVGFDAGKGSLPRIAITTSHAAAEIYLHGAHVTHYQPRNQSPVVFLSAKSHFTPDKAIRGGIPIIFPWFGARAADSSAPQHGFARTLPWDVRQVTPEPDGSVRVTLALGPSDSTRRRLANDFEMLYSVSIGPALQLSLEVRNTSSAAFTFEEALHTYLHVGNIGDVTVDGLAGRTFIDKVDGMKQKVQPRGPMRIDGETDRVYLDTTDTVIVSDQGLGRRITVEKQGSSSTVVWNPWEQKARAMPDFGDDEWPHMLCIETANASDNAITLAPGQGHILRASIISDPQGG